MSHGGLKRARSWKRRIQPKEAYSSPGLLYSEGPGGSRGLVATCADFLHEAKAEGKKSQTGLANESAGAMTEE